MAMLWHIATQGRGDAHFLTAEVENQVRLWSFADRALLAELDTVLDFGGDRLALCERNGSPVIVAGAWERQGICAYAPDGTRLWQRKDLVEVQNLSPTADGRLAVACFDERPMHVLDVRSGQTVATVRGVRGFSASPHGGVGMGDVHGRVVLIATDTWKVHWKAPIEGFAVLAAAGAPRAFAVCDVVESDADGRGSVTCLSLAGKVLWRWADPPDVNCPAIAWDHEAGQWVGVLHHLTREPAHALARWSPDGELVAERPLALAGTCAFLPGGRHLVTSDGAVRESWNGTVVWSLPDPGA